MIYDVIIVGGGAAGLFSGIHLNKNLKKLILEKMPKPGMKVLLSGGERANVSNMDIDPERDYFTQNKKFLLSVFAQYSQWDIMNFFSEAGINIVEEDRGRLILESGDSKELLACLLKKVKENNCELRLKSDVKTIMKKPHPNPLLWRRGDELDPPSPPREKEFKDEVFQLTLSSGEQFKTKKVIVSSGGRSFFQVGTTGEGYNFAKHFGLDIVTPYRALGGLSTKRDLSEISGVSCDLGLKLVDNNYPKKIIYQEKGPFLFTHFGVSGPIIFNAGNALGEYINSKTSSQPSCKTSPQPSCKTSPQPSPLEEREQEQYILENMHLELNFDLEKTPKRIIKFFELSEEKQEISLELQNYRSWKEAKATGGGIDTRELDNMMQAKQVPGLYFIGEVVDITGKTGGFNLQWAWSSAFVCSNGINRK